MQELKEIKERLDKLDTSKLIDIVKNSKQYGYSEEVRFYVLSLLKSKGISQDDLELTGNFKNSNYDTADRVYNSYKNYSKFSFIIYVVLLLIRVLRKGHFIENDFIESGFFALTIIALTIYIYCLVKSFIAQSDFYKLTGEEYSNGALIYFFLGMPFYIIMYFVFTAQMRERLKNVF